MAGLLRQPVRAVALGRLEGLDLETHFLPQGATDEAPDRVGLPAGSLGDLGERCPLLAAQQLEDFGLLAALAGFALFARGGLLGAGGLRLRRLGLRRVLGARGRNRRGQGLGRLPDPGHGRLAVGELLDRRDTRDAVPDLTSREPGHAAASLASCSGLSKYSAPATSAAWASF